jgi:ankyrin repeat protein
MDAIRSLDPDLVTSLLDAGADVEFEDPEGNPPLAYALTYRPGRAEDKEQLERVRRILLDRGASQAKLGQAHLALAAADDDLDAVRRLVADGVNVNAGCPAGLPPLVHAAGRGHLAIVRALSDAGADVNARDASGMTPLMAAARGNVALPGGGYLHVVRFLVEAGADVHLSQNAADSQDITALWYAREFRNPEIADYLKEVAAARKTSRR